MAQPTSGRQAMGRSFYTPRRLKSAQRREEAVRRRVAGQPVYVIAAEMELSEDVIRQYLHEELVTLAESSQEMARELRALTFARLESLLVGVYDAGTKGDHQAIDRALKIIEQERKLLNLDVAPAKDPPPTINVNTAMIAPSHDTAADVLEILQQIGAVPSRLSLTAGNEVIDQEDQGVPVELSELMSVSGS